MKINQIKYKTNKYEQEDIINTVKNNIKQISGARVLLEQIYEDNKKNNIIQNLNVDKNKWKINAYGSPSFFSELRQPKKINLDYFTISSNIIDINDKDMVEYSGIQIGEIENSLLSKLLYFNSEQIAKFIPPYGEKQISKIFSKVEEIIKNILNIDSNKIFITCDNWSLIDIFSYHPTFKPFNNNYNFKLSSIEINNQPIYILPNNSNIKSNQSVFYISTNSIGIIHIKDDIQMWLNQEDTNRVIFTETISMNILNNNIKKIILNK